VLRHTLIHAMYKMEKEHKTMNAVTSDSTNDAPGTSSAKPEVHNISQCRQEDRVTAAYKYSRKSVQFARVVFEICNQSHTETHRQTHTLIT